MFEFLRETEVDILRYLPDYLAEDPHFKAVQLSLTAEHEKQRQRIIDIAKQLFIDTATWGLSDWERVYGIIRDPDSTYDERRSIVKSKIIGMGTITPVMMNYLINQFVPAKDAKFIENVAPGTFRIEVQNAYNADKIKQTVDVYKPAHLSYTIALTATAGISLLMGGIVQTYDIVNIGPADQSVPVADEYLFVGGFVQSYLVINV